MDIASFLVRDTLPDTSFLTGARWSIFLNMKRLNLIEEAGVESIHLTLFKTLLDLVPGNGEREIAYRHRLVRLWELSDRSDLLERLGSAHTYQGIRCDLSKALVTAISLKSGPPQAGCQALLRCMTGSKDFEVQAFTGSSYDGMTAI
jgi:hypothetical protein